MTRWVINSVTRWSRFTAGSCGKKRGQDWPGLIRREMEMELLGLFALTLFTVLLAVLIAGAIVGGGDDWDDFR